MNKNSKIAFVMPWHISERGGGAEVQANYLAQELGARGYKVSYVCQTTNQSKINTVHKVGDIEVHYLKPSGRFPWLDQNKYIEPLKAIQPDYILQRLSSNVSYVLGKYSSKNKCKFIWFCTDDSSPFKDFHLRKFTNFYSIKNLGFVKYYLFLSRAYIMDYYRNLGMTKVDICFNQNDFQKEKLEENFKISSYRMISAHPKPNDSLSSQEKFNKKTILWCANLGEHKRPELFVQLAKVLEDRGMKCIMVGGHADKARVNTLFKNKPKNLKTTGQLEFEESLLHFDSATILVNTSISEGFSNTYIQAWLRGVPVIVFGADPSMVIERESLGYNVKNIDEAIRKIDYLFSNFTAYSEMSTHVKTYADNNHSIKIMTDNFINSINKK